MLEKLVKRYVDRLTKKEVDIVAKENGIIFNDNELDNVFLLIKEKWSIILKKDIDQVLTEIKPIVRIEIYDKVKNLLIVYREKYSHYL